VAEVLAEEGAAVKLKRLGIPDEYSQIGPPKALYERYNLYPDSLKKFVVNLKKEGAF
jgi:transketolase C-terminal domain/subunit